MEILESEPLKREFKFTKNDREIVLDDFNPAAPPQDIIKFYSGQYPELTNAKIDPPEVKGNVITFNIGEEAGTLG